MKAQVIIPASVPTKKDGSLSLSTKKQIRQSVERLSTALGFRRFVEWGSGKRTTYVNVGIYAYNILVANGFTPELKNDAPRGGKLGDYYEITPEAMELIQSLYL